MPNKARNASPKSKVALLGAALQAGILASEVEDVLAQGLSTDRVWDYVKLRNRNQMSKKGRKRGINSLRDYAMRYLGQTRGGQPVGAPLEIDAPRVFRTWDALLIVARRAVGFRVLKMHLREKTNPLLAERARTLLATEKAGLITEYLWFRGDELMCKGTTSKPVPLGHVLETWELGQPPAAPSPVPGPSAVELDWEVLPPGWIRRGFGTPRGEHGPRHTESGVALMRERIDLLDDLGPDCWYVGSHLGERLYYVAVFPRIAIADSTEFGNALYYVTGEGNEWQSVFRRSKQEARAAGAQRIVHTGDWRSRVTRLASRNTT